MTTSPVPSITEELLAELDQKAKAATPGPWESEPSADDEPCAEVKHGAYYVATTHDGVMSRRNAKENAEFIAAASPSTILTLIAHIRCLGARLEKAVTDQARYHWLVHQGESFQWMNIIKVDPDDFESYDEAIDAAIAQEASHE